MTFKENNDKFIEVLKSGLLVCEKGSSIDLHFAGIACEVAMNIKIDQRKADVTKKIILLAITTWGVSVTDHYKDDKDINIHVKVTYNEDGTFSVINTMDADDILGTIKFGEDD